MREIKKIIFHTSDSPDSLDIGAKEIKEWHTLPRPKGNGWSDIGYHYVVRRDGTVEDGRPVERPGAHVRGENSDSIGIVWVGRDKMTDAQRKSLVKKIKELMKKYNLKADDVYGHREFDSGKTCPNIDPEEIRKELREKKEYLPDGPSEEEINEQFENIEKEIFGE